MSDHVEAAKALLKVEHQLKALDLILHGPDSDGGSLTADREECLTYLDHDISDHVEAARALLKVARRIARVEDRRARLQAERALLLERLGKEEGP